MARAYATDINITVLGMLTVTVDAIPARRSEPDLRLTNISPTRETPTPLPVRYIDDETGEQFTAAEMHKAREVDKELVRVTADEVEAIKTPVLPPGEATVTPHLATEVEAVTRPGAALYWLRPTPNRKKVVPPAQTRIYALLVDALATDPDKAWVCDLTIRNKQKMYRLTTWNGHLLLQELIRPGEFTEVPQIEAEYNAQLLRAISEATEANLAPFDPEAHTNFYRDRAAALDEAKRNGEQVPFEAPAAAPVDVDDDDLLAMLTASVKATKPAPKKATARKAARKAS